MPSLKAILFDFDGVLGRTMEDNCRAWAHAFASIGLEFDATEFYLSEGRKASEYVKSVLIRQGRSDASVEALITLKDAHYLEHSNFSFYDSAEALVSSLRGQGIKLGVVSGGSKSRLMRGPALDLLQSLDVVITGDDVSIGKPSPEAYLVAATALSIEPADCVVVENAPLGIQAAKSAGMTCIAICSTLSAEYLHQADYIIPTLSDVSDLLIAHEYILRK